jgi:hypothetical protein
VRPFNLIRAVFWLLVVVIMVTLLILVGGAALCGLSVYNGAQPVGACIKAGIVDEMHSLWSEMLTAILALLAVRRGPPDDKE